jgi:hypothetical protein
LHSDTINLNFKKKVTGDKESTQEKKKASITEVVEKDKEVSVSLLNIQVGLIRKAWKHPSADRYDNEPFSLSSKPVAIFHWITSELAATN